MKLNISTDIIPIGEFKAQMKKWLNSAKDSGHPLIITQNGKPAAVLISPEEFDNLRYTKQFITSVNQGLFDINSGDTFDTEQIDTDNAFASNTFTVPSGQTGTYVIGAYVEYNGGSGSNIRDTGMEIRINGTVQARQQSYFEASYPSRQPQRIEKVVSLGAGDTVTIYGLLNVGSGTCQALGEDKGTNFYGYKLIE